MLSGLIAKLAGVTLEKLFSFVQGTILDWRRDKALTAAGALEEANRHQKEAHDARDRIDAVAEPGVGDTADSLRDDRF